MKNAILFLSVVFSVLFYSCEKEDYDDTDAYKTVVIGHAGFDFSAGISDTVNWENNDCDLVGWHTGLASENPDYPSNSGYTWIRNDQVDTVNYHSYLKNYGKADITTITSTEVGSDSIVSPLFVGDVWVVKCLDGFAKFEVLSVDGDKWEAEIKYVYTSGNSFTE